MSSILVVEDEPGLRDIVCQLLDLEGCPVVAAANGAEALEQIAADPPLVVLLDMGLPVLDGWGVAKALHDRRVQVPLVVMTAAQHAERWAAEIDAAAYVAKPFELDQLLATLARFAPCLARPEPGVRPTAR